MSKQEVERTDSGTRLFAWVSPAFTSNSPVDHTFVTSYDSRLVTHADISAVKEHQAHFWFCWGGFRRKGESEKFPHGLVTSGAGRLQLARCLCESNIPSKEDTAAQGTIFQYGYDGVCHQLGNQILWATEGANRPLTFAGARGYWASTAMWSTYGRDEDEWEAKRRSCAPEWGAAEKGEDAMFGDEFFRHAADVLGHKGLSDALPPLQALRYELDRDLTEMKSSGATEPQLEVRLTKFLGDCADLIGDDVFVDVFEFQRAQSGLVVKGLLEHDGGEYNEPQRLRELQEM